MLPLLLCLAGMDSGIDMNYRISHTDEIWIPKMGGTPFSLSLYGETYAAPINGERISMLCDGTYCMDSFVI